MKKKIVYTDEPMRVGKRVRNFLPPPDQLILTEEKEKVTMSIDKPTIEFFKQEAQKNNTHYQTMMREVLKQYRNHQRGG